MDILDGNCPSVRGISKQLINMNENVAPNASLSKEELKAIRHHYMKLSEFIEEIDKQTPDLGNEINTEKKHVIPPSVNHRRE